jgi:hypothetical protein
LKILGEPQIDASRIASGVKARAATIREAARIESATFPNNDAFAR